MAGISLRVDTDGVTDVNSGVQTRRPCMYLVYQLGEGVGLPGEPVLKTNPRTKLLNLLGDEGSNVGGGKENI